MKKNKILFLTFIIFILAVIGYGVYYTIFNLTSESYEFTNDGYALYVSNKEELKAESFSFSNGTKYSYKKINDDITFNSKDGNVNIDESTLIHYADDSVLPLKNTVGLDLTTIDNNIIFYYNIYKNTLINNNKGSYSIDTINGKIEFKNILIRVDENKYLFMGNNIRVTLNTDEVIDFGNFVYFEYVNGSIVNIYNNSKSYKTLPINTTVVCGDNVINLGDKSISKANKKYITLTNLVIDNDSNIDIIQSDKDKLPDIDNSNGSGDGTSSGNGNNTGNNGNSGNDSTVNNGSNGDIVGDIEEEVDPTAKIKLPVFKVTEMMLTPIKIDAKIEIEDSDNLITSNIDVSIIENSTNKTVYQTTAPMGDTSILLSTSGLYPDTEYTLIAKTDYELEGIEYNKTFVSKIFRTESLGVSFEKSYATENSIVLKLTKENYSKVSSVTIAIYNTNNERLDYSVVDFSDSDITEVVFDSLDNNTEYKIVMGDIVCQGVLVEGGYSESANYKTLKLAPTIHELKYAVDKKNNSFSLQSEKIDDPDYGITNYRYEIYDARQDINTSSPILIVNNKDATNVKVNVDETKLFRGASYTYKLVLEFYDNEKIIEYSKDLGTTMQLDGVTYPTIKFDENYVTWEQINGVIVVDDPSSSIVSDNFKVVYSNSLGIYTSKEIMADATSGTIGININNLRANETYTFQVFADLNLQDGNPTVEKAYLGSVFVQTKKPQPLVATYNSTNNYSQAFNINFLLTNPDGKDSSLEASTLSELTFTLYQGSTTTGTREVSRRVVDVNQDDYQSSIKDAFYDTSALINPTFFNTKNADYKEKVYTLKISGAYDYTDYKNEIEIENDTLTFDINSYIPDIPDDPNKAILPIKILNKAAESFGLEYNEDLDPNTIVGYNLVTNYYNEARNAIRMIYHVYMYDHINKNYIHLEELDKSINFDEEGNIEPVIYELSNGTKNDIVDTDKLRRGNEYYFTYEVMLDIDQDGEEDASYPNIVDESITLRCENLSPAKQTAKFSLYPSISDGTSATWKYKYTDIDNILVEDKLYSFIGNSSYSSSSIDISLNSDYQESKFSSLKAKDFYNIKKYEKEIKSQNPKYVTLTSQYFYGINPALDLKFNTNIEENKLIISIDDYYNKTDEIDKIASVDVTITPTSSSDLASLGKMELKNLTFDSGNIYINLYDIAKYLNVEFKVDVVVYSDSGNTGFDVPSTYKALQNAGITANANYYYINSSNKLSQNSIIEGSEFETEFSPIENLLKITNKLNKSLDLNISIDETGVIYNNNNIILKELKAKELTAIDNIAKFDLIIPSISLLNSSNKLNIIPLLNTAEVTAKLSVASSTRIKDDKIYIDLYKTDENGVNAEFVKTIEKSVNDLKNKFTITGLNPKTNYYIRFKADVYDSKVNDYKEYYLYDIDYKTSGYSYRFYTLSDVGINNIKANFETNSYSDKKIRFDYTLESIHGYDYIEYKIYEKQGEEYKLVDIDIPNSIAFFTNMTFSVDASAGNKYGFTYGKTYKLVIDPVGHYEEDGVTKKISLGSKSHEFTLKDYEEPYIGISSSKTLDTISFKVSIDDNTKILKDGKYSVKLVTSNYDVITSEDNIDSSIINKTFTYSKDDYNLIENNVYIFVVTLNLDYNNSNSNFTEKTQTKSIRFGDSVNLGSVSASKNQDSNYAIDIIFADSYKLDSINRISYTVSSTAVSYFSTGSGDFNVRYDVNNNLYTYTMKVLENENFRSGIMYTITMNFYTDTTLVAQDEISYYYGGS